jgi:hypothetical protein
LKIERKVTTFTTLDHLTISLNHLRHEHQREAYKRRLLRLARYRADDSFASPEKRRNAGMPLRTVNNQD